MHQCVHIPSYKSRQLRKELKVQKCLQNQKHLTQLKVYESKGYKSNQKILLDHFQNLVLCSLGSRCHKQIFEWRSHATLK